MGDVSRSAAAAARVVPGAELTSSPLEKEFGRCCDFLVKVGVDVNAGDRDGITALHLAARYGLLFIIRRLLARGANPSSADNSGNTPLHWASAFQQVRCGSPLASTLEIAFSNPPAYFNQTHTLKKIFAF